MPRSIFQGLDSPIEIQNFVDTLAYDARPGTRSPRWVIAEKTANCFEGALFAAAALRTLGYRPLIVDLVAANDDDHIIAVFRKRGRWGALAKSNFSVLRFREPVYRTIRELAMSYFDFYINTRGRKSLRSYSLPLNLARFDSRRWVDADEDLGYIGDALNRARHFPLISKAMARNLNEVDRRLLKSIFLGVKNAGLYKAR